jgi:hypothetical protein
MLGWPAEMAIGSHITLIVPEERRAEEDEVLALFVVASGFIISIQSG